MEIYISHTREKERGRIEEKNTESTFDGQESKRIADQSLPSTSNKKLHIRMYLQSHAIHAHGQIKTAVSVYMFTMFSSVPNSEHILCSKQSPNKQGNKKRENN